MCVSFIMGGSKFTPYVSTVAHHLPKPDCNLLCLQKAQRKEGMGVASADAGSGIGFS